MQLNNLPGIVDKSKKRVGRGNGSGKGKTSARGQKGQKARGGVRADFEGGQLRLIKRLPFKRGVGNMPAIKAFGLKLGELSGFKAGSTINIETLRESGLIPARASKVKIIGGGEVSVALTVQVPTTQSVKVAIEKAGGTVQ